MAITNAFREAVSSGNTRSVRIMMKNSLLVDPTFSEFEEMERAAKSVSGLFDTHDGIEFEMDKANWNDDYMNTLMVQVVGNFSRERIAHLKEVVRYLHPASAKPAPQSKPSRTPDGQHPNQSTTSSPYRKQYDEDMQNGRIVRVASGAAIGAVVGGTIGAISGAAGGTIAGAAVAGAAIAGVIAAATSGEGK